MSARLPRLSGRMCSAVAVAVTASTLVVGAGLGEATAATFAPVAASASSVKVATKSLHARQRVTFLFHSKSVVGAKSRWSVGFGDHYAVSGKGRPPTKAWHVFNASGRYAIRLTTVDAAGKQHVAKVVIAVAAAMPGVSAPVGASGVVGGVGASSTTLNGVEVSAPQHAGTATPTPPVIVPSTAVPTTAAPTSTPPAVIPTVIPTTIPTVVPTTVPPVVAPVVSLLLGLNVSGLLRGSLLNFTTSTVQGSSAIASWAVTWGDGVTSTGSGVAPTALTHTYASLGTHTARLTETAVDGATALSTNLVFVTI
jgi:hypothetical protein